MSDEVLEANIDHLVMISGKSSTGKSASLMGLAFDEDRKPFPKEKQKKVLYLCTEAGKKLPFPNHFTTVNIIDPEQVVDAFEQLQEKLEEEPDAYSNVIIDSQTFLMDQYETQYVIYAENTMAGWSEFQQYWKRLVQEHVARCPIPVIFTAHTADQLNKDEGVMECKIPVKGALKDKGIEAYFSCVISTKKVAIKDLKKYKSPLLNITKKEEELGFKYCFQTQPTAKTKNERIRSPMFMWADGDNPKGIDETFIDNNIDHVLKRLNEFYG